MYPHIFPEKLHLLYNNVTLLGITQKVTTKLFYIHETNVAKR